MKLSLAATAAATLALAAPATSPAASLTTAPVKPCYGTGDTVNFAGAGFTPGGSWTSRATAAPSRAPRSAPPDGTVTGDLNVVQPNGQAVRTYTATDRRTRRSRPRPSR